jgi:hypothetical protein
MLTVFEVHLVPGSKADDLLSAEAKSETNAQVMTVEDAKKVGFAGLPDMGPDVRLIAVNRRDGGWIRNILEASPVVSGFNVHDVDI